jgi:hypothetical protein
MAGGEAVNVYYLSVRLGRSIEVAASIQISVDWEIGWIFLSPVIFTVVRGTFVQAILVISESEPLPGLARHILP